MDPHWSANNSRFKGPTTSAKSTSPTPTASTPAQAELLEPSRGPNDAPLVGGVVAAPFMSRTERPADGTDAVVPLALISSRPHTEWAQPLQYHVRTADGRLQAVPRDEWVSRPYTRADADPTQPVADGDGVAVPPPTMADTLRARREARSRPPFRCAAGRRKA